MIRPDVVRRAERAPIRGQGLGFTMLCGTCGFGGSLCVVVQI